MWLSNAFKYKANNMIQADAGPVSIEGSEPAIYTDGEKRDTEILRPANILRLPKVDEQQVILNLPDGKSVIIGVISSDIPQDLEAGEVYIKTENATVCLKNSGVYIDGDVSISGSLEVNGSEVNGA